MSNQHFVAIFMAIYSIGKFLTTFFDQTDGVMWILGALHEFQDLCRDPVIGNNWTGNENTVTRSHVFILMTN